MKYCFAFDGLQLNYASSPKFSLLVYTLLHTATVIFNPVSICQCRMVVDDLAGKSSSATVLGSCQQLLGAQTELLKKIKRAHHTLLFFMQGTIMKISRFFIVNQNVCYYRYFKVTVFFILKLRKRTYLKLNMK